MVPVAATKRSWNTYLHDNIQYQARALCSNFLGQWIPEVTIPIIEELLAKHPNPQLPVDFRNRLYRETGALNPGARYHLTNIMGEEWLANIPQNIDLEEAAHWSEDNPWGFPTYEEVGQILRRYAAVLEHLKRNITNKKLNPHRGKEAQDHIWETRYQSKEHNWLINYQPYGHLWTMMMPEGMIPYNTVKIRILRE